VQGAEFGTEGKVRSAEFGVAALPRAIRVARDDAGTRPVEEK